MIDHSSEILDNSNKTIQKLSDLTYFFEDRIIMNIYLQTQVIHKLFEDNPDIDINKLELFHLQFTDTLIELLEKIKKRNERIVNMNKKMINTIRDAIWKDGGFDGGKQEQTKHMSSALRSLYTAIYNQSNDYPFKENINLFCVKFYKEYFHEIHYDISDKLIEYDKKDTYRQAFASIDKKLLLALGESNFNIVFFAGVKSGSILLEIYRITDTDIYFTFVCARNIFLPCDINILPYKDWENINSKREKQINELKEKNKILNDSIKYNLKLIDEDISLLLETNYQKIADIDFISNLENIDSQANILKSMLDTKII